MFLVISILSLFLLANAADIGNGTDPHCDLVDVSHVDIQKNGNGTLTIDFSWERKVENYKSIGTPLRMYVIRHGPMENGELANTSEIMEIPFPEKDALTLRNVKPYVSYGLQVCAVTSSYRFLFQNDIWDHAWIGSMDLSSYGTPVDQQQPNDDAPETAKSESKTYKPECDLVQTSHVSIDEDSKTNTLVVFFSWDKKLTSYSNIRPVDHYVVRYGREAAWGAKIDENTAGYMTVSNDSTSVVLKDVPRGSYFAVQVCAVSNDMAGMDIDWDKDAWLGGMDFTSYPVNGSQSEPEDSNELLEMSAPENGSFIPQCDLVGNSYVDIDENRSSLTIHFAWDKKDTSYQSIGQITGYKVRYGRQIGWASGIEQLDEHFLEIPNDTAEITIPNVPRGGYFGIQICAEIGTFEWPEAWKGWQSSAWLGSMDLTSFGTDTAETSIVQEMSNRVSEMPYRPETVVFHSALGTDYTILLAILAAITVIFIVVACAWVAMWRKRRATKAEPMYFDPTQKQGTVFP